MPVKQAVILAAGLGTRMGSLTKDRPKPLLTIAHKSLLHHGLDALPNQIDEVILVVGYLADQIKKSIGSEYRGKRVRYVEQKELKGTAHALSMCQDHIKDHFLVIAGDDLYSKEDLDKMTQNNLSILVREISDNQTEDYNAKVLLDSSGNLENIIERQKVLPGDLVNCSAYVLDNSYFDLPLVKAGKSTEEFGLPQTMLGMIGQGKKISIVRATFWKKVTTPEDLE